jgi:hypothetical protein
MNVHPYTNAHCTPNGQSSLMLKTDLVKNRLQLTKDPAQAKNRAEPGSNPIPIPNPNPIPDETASKKRLLPDDGQLQEVSMLQISVSAETFSAIFFQIKKYGRNFIQK